ncbi:hypothetical protein Q4Q39_04970 [Flavivirga amylovorans]|uniref:Uncharacterized protein n=1 Tax=Flavivirga amylovorans TaxID=870486 RepID=A0ABT8WZF0_9FLAO|nr:hypothetical protein [Flavivirga amylovorans]
MDQKSELWNTAKHILNHQNEHPYTDNEIKEIIRLLEDISNVVCHNLTH